MGIGVDVHRSPVRIILLTVWLTWPRGRNVAVLHGRTGHVHSGPRIRLPRTRNHAHRGVARRINAGYRSRSGTGHAASHDSIGSSLPLAAPTASDSPPVLRVLPHRLTPARGQPRKPACEVRHHDHRIPSPHVPVGARVGAHRRIPPCFQTVATCTQTVLTAPGKRFQPLWRAIVNPLRRISNPKVVGSSPPRRVL